MCIRDSSISAEHGEGISDLLSVLMPLADRLDSEMVPIAEPVKVDIPVEDLDDDHFNKKPLQIAVIGRPNAGKSTLINTVCGILNFDEGSITVDELDIKTQYRKARSLIGIVPQELNLEAFETIWDNVNYSRGLYGKSPNHSYTEKLLKELSLWDKKNSKLRELSGGMKRRVLIAKALSHEPKVLFLDEPTASVDVELRKDMWEVVKRLKQEGVTIILTTHYIEEAEEIADRVGIINNCLLYTSPSPRDLSTSRMPSSA